jgi:hypothetical protein
MMFGVAGTLVPFIAVPAVPTTREDEFKPVLVVHTFGKPVGQLLVPLERVSVTRVPLGADGLTAIPTYSPRPVLYVEVLVSTSAVLELILVEVGQLLMTWAFAEP